MAENNSIWKTSKILITNKNLVLIMNTKWLWNRAAPPELSAIRLSTPQVQVGMSNAWHNERGTFSIRLKSVQDTWGKYRDRWPGLTFPNSAILVPVLQPTAMDHQGLSMATVRGRKDLGLAQKRQSELLDQWYWAWLPSFLSLCSSAFQSMAQWVLCGPSDK